MVPGKIQWQELSIRRAKSHLERAGGVEKSVKMACLNESPKQVCYASQMRLLEQHELFVMACPDVTNALSLISWSANFPWL